MAIDLLVALQPNFIKYGNESQLLDLGYQGPRPTSKERASLVLSKLICILRACIQVSRSRVFF